MATTSIPLHELVGDNGPALVLDLIAGLVSAALAKNVAVLHPAEVAIGRGARVNLQLHRDLPPHPLTSAPELRSVGSSPATLVYAAGALGAMAALGQVSPAPNDEAQHAQWLRDLARRLASRWDAGAGTEEAIALVIGCLERDPTARPSPHGLLELIRDVGFPSEQGLVSRTGYAPPSLEGMLPVEVALRSQGVQWPPVLSVVPELPRGALERPRVKIRPPRNTSRKRRARAEMRWAAFGAGVVIAILVLGTFARWAMPDAPTEEPTAVHPGG